MLRVVKLGGSLLRASETKARLLSWLNQQPTCKTILIVGGGELVDCIRDMDNRHGLGEAACHRLAMACMSVTCKLVSEWLPSALLLDDLKDVHRVSSSLIMLDSQSWVLNNSLLPRTWQLTSDSISAAVAKELGAEELVMLKSSLPPDSGKDFFDPLFSRFATTSTIRIVNLRSSELLEATYQSHSG